MLRGMPSKPLELWLQHTDHERYVYVGKCVEYREFLQKRNELANKGITIVVNVLTVFMPQPRFRSRS